MLIDFWGLKDQKTELDGRFAQFAYFMNRKASGIAFNGIGA